MVAASLDETLLILLIFIVSAAAQGMLGFGFGIIAMTLLPLTMGLKDAVTLLAILNAAMMVLAIHWQKHALRWNDARFIVYGSLVGIPLGAYMVHTLPEGILLMILGTTMVYVGAEHFLKRQKTGQAPIRSWEIPIGIASGVLAAGFNMGGPPIVAYVYSRNWTPDQAKAVLAAVFVTTGVSRLFFIGFTGENLPKIFWLAVVMVVPSAVMLRLGISWGRRIPQQSLRPLVFAYLGVAGLYYLLLDR